MRVRGKKRNNFFKLGRRGRRGRIAYDGRWGHVIRNSTTPERSTELSRQNSYLSVNRHSETTEVFHARNGTASVGTLHASCERRSLLVTGSRASMDCQPRSPDNTASPRDNQAQRTTLGDRERTLPDTMGGYLPPEQDRHVSAERSCPVRGSASPSIALQQTEDSGDTEEVNDVNMRPAGSPYDDTVHSGDNLFADEDLDAILPSETEIPTVGDPEPAGSCIDAGQNMVSRRGINLSRNGEAAYDWSTQRRENDDTDPDIECRRWRDTEIVSGYRKLSQWQNLLSVLLVNGTVRVSVEVYELFRLVLNTVLRIGFPEEETLPAYSTVERSLLPKLRAWALLRRETSNALVDLSTVSSVGEEHVNHTSLSYTLLLPSAWMDMDVSCSASWNILKTASREAQRRDSAHGFYFIEWTPMIRRRHTVLRTLSTFMFAPRTEECDDGQQSMHYIRTTYSVKLRLSSSLPQPLTEMLRGSANSEQMDTRVTLYPLRSFKVVTEPSAVQYSTVPITKVLGGTVPALSRVILGLWSAGDFCTSLRTPQASKYFMVLVHHQAQPGQFDRRLELVCVPYKHTQTTATCILQWNLASKVTASEFRLASHRMDRPHRTIPYLEMEKDMVPSFGRLKNGKLYFIDRILLYSDGFSQYNFKKGSAGGIYSVSLNYPAQLRRSRENVRVHALTPPGVSTSEGLRLIPDLVRSATQGNNVRNADGEDMNAFTDIVGYVGDYAEVGHILDVVGHSGNAPCHLCSFLRVVGQNPKTSRYGNSTNVHSADGCYARFGDRTKGIRASNLSNESLVSLGLNTNQQAAKKASPLMQLYDALHVAMSENTIPLTDSDVPVVQPMFDPYRSVFVAPDHLLGGIAKNELTFVFRSLPNLRRRKQADTLVCQMLERNGLVQQKGIYNFDSSSLYTTSISGTFCTLLVGVPVLTEVVESLCCPRELGVEDHMFLRDIIANMGRFRKLVVSTYWYPTSNVDDPRSISKFNDDGGCTRIYGLQDMCIEYIYECNELCKKSAVAREELDKPNLHRLLELYMHSIPAMGHVRHFSELIFECAHQPLKRAMANSNFRRSHLQAMKHRIADDWKYRLSTVFNENASVSEETDSRKSLVNLLFGRDAQVKQRVDQQPDLESRMSELMRNEVLNKVIGPTPVHLREGPVTNKWCLTNLEEHPRMLAILKPLFVVQCTIV